MSLGTLQRIPALSNIKSFTVFHFNIKKKKKKTSEVGEKGILTM